MIPIRHRASVVALALGVVLACLPACLVKIERNHTRYHMEALTFVTSQETWLRFQRGEREAWRRPTWNGELRVNKPPLTVWVNFLAWAGLSESDPIDVLVARARLAGVAATAAALLSIFWIGWQLGGARLAWSAALATGSMFLLIRQTRIAAYDTHLVGWSTLAVAAGLAALRAERLGPRAILAAALAAVGLTGAILVKGPIALLLAALPLVAIGAVSPQRWPAVRRALSLAAIGAALAAPWYVYLLIQEGGVAAALYKEYRAERRVFQPPWYYLLLLGLTFPWSAWLVGGLARAWQTRRERLERLLYPLVWLAVVFVALSLPGAKRQRYICPALPAAGLLAAAAWFDSTLYATRFGALLRRLHWSLLCATSVALGAFLFLQEALVRRGLLRGAEFPVNPWLGVAAAGVLLGVALWGARLHARGRLAPAFLCSFLWMEAAATGLNFSYAQTRHGVYEQLPECRRVMETVGDAPLYYLKADAQLDVQPDAKFLAYTRRIVPPVPPEGLVRLAGQKDKAFIVALDRSENLALLRKAGFEPLYLYRDGGAPRWLCRWSGAASD